MGSHSTHVLGSEQGTSSRSYRFFYINILKQSFRSARCASWHKLEIYKASVTKPPERLGKLNHQTIHWTQIYPLYKVSALETHLFAWVILPGACDFWKFCSLQKYRSRFPPRKPIGWSFSHEVCPSALGSLLLKLWSISAVINKVCV